MCGVYVYGMCDVCMWDMYVYMCGVGGGEVCGRRYGVCTECVGVWAHHLGSVSSL